MSNRFKFKCFNKLQNKMYEVRSISYYQGDVKRIGVDDNGKILIFDEYENNIDNTILMQCTGLKDKNDKLIYEGDVVIEHYYNTKETAIKKVFFDEKVIGFAYTDGIEYNQLSITDSDRLQVIGNIYEKEELLNE